MNLVPTTPNPLGVGIVGAGHFASFIADATRDVAGVALGAVADPVLDRAHALAQRHGARAFSDWAELLRDDAVDVIVVATPPGSHAEIAAAALEAGRHVFCEKPLALSASQAGALAAQADAKARVLVVDHVLRYNPILRALTRLADPLLGRVQRFCFENDASDEDLPPDHWFWDESVSGGIFLEHGVHFFDAADLLIGRPPTGVQASAARRSPDGPVDLVSATVRHGGDVLATHTHSFTHAHRCERQLMRLDYGAAEVRVEGWIPVDAVIDAWTDESGARLLESLPSRTAELMEVDGFRLGPAAHVTAHVVPVPGSALARGRGVALDLSHHGRVHLTLGGPSAKAAVYAESVRAALTDLVTCVRTGARPRSGGPEAAAAVATAAAATDAARRGRTTQLADPQDRTQAEGRAR